MTWFLPLQLGSDTFEAISKTPIPGFDAKDLGNTVSDKSFDVWKQVFEKFFGPPVAGELRHSVVCPVKEIEVVNVPF